MSSHGGRVGSGSESQRISSSSPLQDIGTGVGEWMTYQGEDGASVRGESPPKMANAIAMVLIMVAASRTC